MKKMRIDLKGKKFERLLVMRFSYVDNDGRARWQCKCDCGNEVIVRSSDLRLGRTRSCGCLARELSSKRMKKPKGISAQHRLWHDYRRHAIERDFEFKLSKEDFLILTSGDCYYCGISPNKVTKYKNANGQYTYNGIDRIDNNEGYVLDNCVPCCRECNFAKHDMDIDDFLMWLDRIIEYRMRK